jgi:hypothetical protein
MDNDESLDREEECKSELRNVGDGTRSGDARRDSFVIGGLNFLWWSG